MTISINWATKVINVPKADLTNLGGGVYELDVDWFRLQLKNIEDSEEGMNFPDTHRHNTEVTLGSLVLARVVEIINGYTITFEDGQYAVNLVGANNNISDVANVNQVSIRSSNSAGMIVVGGDAVDPFATYEIWPGYTYKRIMRAMASVLAGKSSGGGTTFRDIPDAVDQVVGTVDVNKDRTSVTLGS
jgi:hypothetical protein